MKLALLVAAVDPGIRGVMVFGDRGTGKSTAVRAMPGVLPQMMAVSGCRYGCDPEDPCEECVERRARGERLRAVKVPVPVVDLPLGATEDRVVGSLDLERALTSGEKHFEPGLLARANRGFLYVDEVNLLEDHLVDLLLDVAASGVNVVEREGLSLRHPARFVMVGSGNPEEGDLRPQLLDRFGLSVDVRTPTAVAERIDVIRRRDAFDRDPDAFLEEWKAEDAKVLRRIQQARKRIDGVVIDDEMLRRATALCVALGTDGLRGELTLMRASRATAALDGAKKVVLEHLRRVAPLALRHRLRRNPLDDTSSTTRVERAVAELLVA
jgi:magnesium chelatase subunit I